jgi:hypothetical protein
VRAFCPGARTRERYVSTSNVKQLLFQFPIGGAILPDKLIEGWGLTHLIHSIAQFGARPESFCYGAK